jgi:putative tryptophan/tyrosine transport system substrate-binding protein
MSGSEARLMRRRDFIVGLGGTAALSLACWSPRASAQQRTPVPVVYDLNIFPAVGGLMTYGTSPSEGDRQVGLYLGRILKGTRPADLPVVQATKFEFVINLKTAKSLGLTIPETLLATADEVIQ